MEGENWATPGGQMNDERLKGVFELADCLALPQLLTQESGREMVLKFVSKDNICKAGGMGVECEEDKKTDQALSLLSN